MLNSVTYPILGHTLGYTNDQQLHQYCHLMALGVQVGLQIFGMIMFNNVMRCMFVLQNNIDLK